MYGYSVSEGGKQNYAIANNGASELVQLIESAPNHIHWLIVRDGAQEQRIALTTSTLMLLCKAVSIHPFFKRLKDEQESK